MNNIINDYAAFLNEIVARHPLSSNGTAADMLRLLRAIPVFAEEYQRKGKEKGNELIESAPGGVDRNDLVDKMQVIFEEIYDNHVPANLNVGRVKKANQG